MPVITLWQAQAAVAVMQAVTVAEVDVDEVVLRRHHRPRHQVHLAQHHHRPMTKEDARNGIDQWRSGVIEQDPGPDHVLVRRLQSE